MLEPTLAELQAQMDQVTGPLIQRRLPEEIFDVEAALAEGHSFKPFFKMVRMVAALDENELLTKALAKGGNLGMWDLHTDMTRPEFVGFARWLQSKPGQDFLYALQRSGKLKRKATAAITPTEIAYHEVFDQMRQKWTAEEKALRAVKDKEIAELERQVRLLKRERDQMVEELKKKFEPASLYEDPVDEEIGATAVVLYEADCRAKGKAIKSVALGKTEYAKTLFGQEARKKFVIQFAAQAAHREPLMAFLAEEILSFRANADEKQAKRALFNLVTIGGGEAADAAIARAEEAAAERARRNAPPARAPAPVPPPRAPRGRGAGARRPTARSPVRTRSRTPSQGSAHHTNRDEGDEADSAPGGGGGETPEHSRQ